ncbi:hypothetical protein [Pasteurella oralis]|uniref:hypothetical protein n=1 Tax=Pasteurella oralis TaxID=1071947 RepID=UPI000C7D507C|nr:hypothetical protein [Pasteurella oralis]
MITQLIINMPDCYINLSQDSPYFFCSSQGECDSERLQFFIDNIFPYWETHQCSLHQLADYLQQYDIELYQHTDSSSELEKESLPANYFAFWISFKKQFKGELFIQCELLSQEQVQ